MVFNKSSFGTRQAKHRQANGCSRGGSCEFCHARSVVFAVPSTVKQKQTPNVSMPKINHRVALSFAQLPDGDLSDFSTSTITGMTGNPLFPAPTVSLTVLQPLTATFVTKVAAAADGGRFATAEKNEAREDLIAALRQNASYVQSIAGTDLPGLLSSGFLAASNNTVSTPLPKPVVDNIDNFQSTKLMMRLKQIPNYRAIEARRKQGTGDWQNSGIFTKASRIEQSDLIPGQTYDFQFRAIGGSTGYSDWSDPISHMAT